MQFYEDVEKHRYVEEFHIPLAVDFDRPGQRMLEVGSGLGTDGRRFARSGADYTAADLSFQSLLLARRGFELSQLPANYICMDAENMPFTSAAFDFVYSHGVLHHTPRTDVAFEEIERILKPGGTTTVMLYARGSLSYIAALTGGRIRLIKERRRLGHSDFNRLVGLPAGHRRRIPKEVVINNSTDGVGNPVARFYSRRELAPLLGSLRILKVDRHYIPRRRIPVLRSVLPKQAWLWLGRLVGGYWYITAEKKV